jgi:hypothetical protein
MKKMAVIATGLLSLGCLGEFEMPGFGLDTSVEFSTDNVFRGCRIGKHSFSPKAEISWTVFEKGRMYDGVDSALTLQGEVFLVDQSEVTLYVQLSYDVVD